MQCRDVRDLGDSYLGEELLVETNHEILGHLESCPECRAELAARRELRARTRTAFLQTAELAPRPGWSEELAASLRASSATTMSRRSFGGAWLALAATLLLTAGVSLRVVPEWRGASALAALARLAVGDHRNCAVRFNLAERPISLEQAAAAYDAAYRVLETTPAAAVAAPSGTIRVVERHSCVFEGRRFAHVVMQYRGHLVSILMTRDAGGPLTRIPTPHGGAAADTLQGTDAFDVAYSHAGRHVVFFVTDGGAEALHEVAQAIAPDLSRELAGALTE